MHALETRVEKPRAVLEIEWTEYIEQGLRSLQEVYMLHVGTAKVFLQFLWHSYNATGILKILQVISVESSSAAAHYSDLEKFYERLNPDSAIHLPLWLPGTASLAEANRNAQLTMARSTDPRPGQRILDAGCGLGGTSIWLAREFGVNMLGISNSASNVEMCRRAAKQLGPGALTQFETADLNEDFAAAESFDAIWSLESLNYLYPKTEFVRRAFTALKPGGLWLCMDRYMDRSRAAENDTALQTVTRGFYTADHWEPAEALLSAMGAAGFESIAFENFTAAVLAAPRMQRVNLASAGRALATGLSHPRSVRAMLRAFRIIRASYALMERGVMTYGLLSGRRPQRPSQ